MQNLRSKTGRTAIHILIFGVNNLSYLLSKMRKLAALCLCMTLVITAFCSNIITTSIYFDVNSAELSDAAKSDLASLFPLPEGKIVDEIIIKGFASPKKEKKNFLPLARARAVNTHQYLYFTELKSMVYKIEDDISNELWANDDRFNRRVEITIKLALADKAVDEATLAALFPDAFGGEEIAEAPERTSKLTKSMFARGRSKLDKVYFKGNSAQYLESSQESLDELSRFMRQNEDAHILIVGHVNGTKLRKAGIKREAKYDPTITVYESAEAMSLARAESIKQFLIQKGISPDRINTVGKGGSEMEYPNPKTDWQSEANRRIEIVLQETPAPLSSSSK